MRADNLQVPVWKCKDGRELPITEMTAEHINNCLKMLRRNGFMSPAELHEAWANLPYPCMNGEYAQMAAEQEFGAALDKLAQTPITPFIDYFRQELKRRGYQCLPDA